MQCPIDVDPQSESETDIAVIEGQPDEFLDALPTQRRIRLVTEVSDSSLAFDRSRKARVYASAGIAEYWVLSVADRTVEVYREPICSDSRYAAVASYTTDEAITPLAASTAVCVADLW